MIRFAALLITAAVSIDLMRHTVAWLGTLDRWFVTALVGMSGTVGVATLLVLGTFVWWTWGLVVALGRLWTENAPERGTRSGAKEGNEPT